MIDVVHAFLFYLNPERPIPVHSPYSSLPYHVSVYFSRVVVLFCWLVFKYLISLFYSSVFCTRICL